MQTQVSTQPRTQQRTNREAIPVYDTHITSTPGTCGGKPRIVGRRITVSNVATWFLQMGLTVDEIVQDYDLSHAQVHAALAYYYDYRAEIDAREAADLAEAEALRQQYPSKLRELVERNIGSLLTDETEYPIWTPLNAFGAADTLVELLVKQGQSEVVRRHDFTAMESDLAT